MLLEEADAFAMSDDDVGCISELAMDIKMTSDQPVQKNDFSIPRRFIQKLKAISRTHLTQVSSGSLHPHSQVVLSVSARKMVE